MPRIIDPTPAAIAEAAARLRAGLPVAFPTETVYGLGCDAFNPEAIERVFALKGRPHNNPLIAHVGDQSSLHALVADWTFIAEQLVDAFWPGPLTLIVPKRDNAPATLSGGRATIAVRAPKHPIAQALLAAFGGPIAAPSANRSGHISPTLATHVAHDFEHDNDLVILDGGMCAIGLESTVLDLTVHPPHILRLGAITEPMLREVIGDVRSERVMEQDASPGTAARHYAPSTPTEIIAPELLSVFLASHTAPAAVLCFDESMVFPPHRPIEMPQGAGEYATRLYRALREADAMDVDRIVIEAPPTSNEIWRAIGDRLRRAAAQS